MLFTTHDVLQGMHGFPILAVPRLCSDSEASQKQLREGPIKPIENEQSPSSLEHSIHMGKSTVILVGFLSDNCVALLQDGLIHAASKAVVSASRCRAEKVCICQGLRSSTETKDLQLQVETMLLVFFGHRMHFKLPSSLSPVQTNAGVLLQVLMRPGPFSVRPFMHGTLKLKPTRSKLHNADMQQLGW